MEESKVLTDGTLAGSKPLSDAFVQELVRNLKLDKNKYTFGGYIPPNVIGYAERLEYNHVIWFTAPSKQRLLFKKDTRIPTGEYIVPGVVWSFGNTLELYAYKEWKGINTELYWPPFYNCSGCSVCLGTAKDYLRAQGAHYSFLELMESVENTFWNSTFTHAGSTDNIKGNFSAMYEKCIKVSEFPYSYLLPAGLTLKELTNEIFNS